MNIEKDVIETLNKTIKFYEDLDILYNSKEPCPEIRAIKWIITAYEKEKEKNSKAIRHIEVCKTSLGNYILSPNETEYLLEILKEE